MKQLILGGARSGKSKHALDLAMRSQSEVVFIATATAGDTEMAARIERHQIERPAHWRVVEEPLDLAEALRLHMRPGHFVIVDCLTLWLSNILTTAEAQWQEYRTAVLDVVTECDGDVVMVSNEVGMGIVPMGELSRRFVDEAGRMHQALAQVCDVVTWVVAGIATDLKRNT